MLFLIKRRLLFNEGESHAAKFIDRLSKGEGKIYRDELIEGTRKLMKTDCNTDVIKNGKQHDPVF